jgi:site-specific recombinase XerD
MSRVQLSERVADERSLGSYEALKRSFHRKLLSENKSPRTIQTYGESLRRLGDFLLAQGMPTEVASIRREHVEAFIAHLLEHYKPATAANRYRALRIFFT